MKRLLPALLLAFALVEPLEAKEFKLPEKSPKLSIQVPDDWETETTDEGFDTQNKDHNVYLVLESAGSLQDHSTMIEETIKALKGQGKKLEPPAREKSTTQILGVVAKVATWNTADEHGPLTVTMTSFEIGGVWFLLTQSIATDADRATVDKMKKAVGSLALTGGAKSLGSALTGGPKDAAPAKPAAPPAPAKPAATEAPAVASAKPSAPAEPPPAAKSVAALETVSFPKENPMLSFKKPADWAISVSPSGKNVMTVAKPQGPNVTFSTGGDPNKTMTDAELKDIATQSARATVENGPVKGLKTGPIQNSAIGPFKGFLIEMTGEVEGQPLIIRQHVLRNAKGRMVSIIVPAPPGPLYPETRALLDSIVPLP